MVTRAGFFVFLGLIIGAIGGVYTPLTPIWDSLLGGLLGFLIAWFIERRR